MNILRVILATLVIFGTGAVSGYFIGKAKGIQTATETPKLTSTGNNSSAPPLDKGRRSFMDRMQKDLALTDEQRETIGKIFADSRDRSKELWKEIREPMDNEVKRVHEEIKAVLSPEQSLKFDEITERDASLRNKKRGSHADEENASEPIVKDQCFIRSLPTHQCAL